ncbi:hypothetical protein B0H13DRAFT_2306933 [Mycena leptocephala]|nr:hypothetical protein B0H13DRAFT_2306933 [Mycena leptocephala]
MDCAAARSRDRGSWGRAARSSPRCRRPARDTVHTSRRRRSHNRKAKHPSQDTEEALRKSRSRTLASKYVSPDGACIMSGSSDHTIRVWDARTGKAVTEPIQAHTSLVQSVAFSPDGARMVQE